MKIAKYLHSCILVENKSSTYLIDPGIFTFHSKVLDITSISSLGYLLITHEHPDHMYLPFIKQIIAKFPDITIISNQSVAAILDEEQIHAQIQPVETVSVDTLTHEMLWDKKAPVNSVFHIDDILTHPGDNLHFDNSTPVVCLPITAPWGSTADAVKKALALRPKIIIPIHDFSWKDTVRQEMYQRLKNFFATQQIDFKFAESGEWIEV